MGDKPNDDFAHGWRLTNWARVAKDPPIWLSAILHIAALVFSVTLVSLAFYAIFRLLVGTGDYSGPAGADHARNLLIALGAIVAAPFVVWRTWIGYQQWLTSVEQVNVQNETLQTNLLTKAIEMLSASSDLQNIDDGAKQKYKIKTEVRIGAILILKRIASESSKDSATIVDILAAYIIENTRDLYDSFIEQILDEKQEFGPFDSSDVSRSRSDIEKAFRVLIDLVIDSNYENVVSLPKAALTGISLAGKTIRNIDLSRTVLINMDFSNSILKNCTIGSNHMDSCDLSGADLTESKIELWGNRWLSGTDEFTKMPETNYEVIKRVGGRVLLKARQ